MTESAASSEPSPPAADKLGKRWELADPDADPAEWMEAFVKQVTARGLELYPAQEEAILALFSDQHVILNTPTGSGKSLVASAMLYKMLVAGGRAYYSCPIKALVSEKFRALCQEFGPENVGMITGDASVHPDAPIICCTAEILMNLALREGEAAPLSDVIIDEFHYYADRDRGVAWQVPLLTLSKARFLLMSATMGDASRFAQELERRSDASCAVVSSRERPVPLRFDYSEEPLDHTVSSCLSAGEAPIYVVCFTQAACAQHAQAFTSINCCSKSEKQEIAKELQELRFSSPYGREIKKLLLNGIGIHHAGLLPKYRMATEKLAQAGRLKIICGTDSLGVGINVPIRTVIFTQLCKFDGQKTVLLSVRDFHQIAGRAGRRGFDNDGRVIAQAPAHVIENIKMERKAALKPQLRKKMVKAKAPSKAYVAWNEETFRRLCEAESEALRSSFRMDHGILLQVLARQGDACRAVRQLLRDCHESDAVKARLRHHSFTLYRSLLERKLLSTSSENGERRIHFAEDLQQDFSLHHTLSLFFLDTIKRLDPFDEDYPLRVLSLAEAILENPRPILLRQLDRLKRERVFELKMAGMDYDERMEELEKIEYPKPDAELIYNEFNAFAAAHPWVQDNIRPKSIAREMYEQMFSFGEYIKEYGLERSEGLLLRHLSSVYKILQQSVPHELKNDAFDDMCAYFETIVKFTDASLIDEWERLKNGSYAVSHEDKAASIQGELLQISNNERLLRRLLLSALHKILRALALGQDARCAELIRLAARRSDDSEQREESDAKRLDTASIAALREQYVGEYGPLRWDAAARSSQLLSIVRDDSALSATLQLIDEEGSSSWELGLSIDAEASDVLGRVVFDLNYFGDGQR